MVLFVILLAIGVYYFFKPSVPDIGVLGSTHIHADFKLYINGNMVNLSKPEFQVRAKAVHVEEGIGDIIHVHATNMFLGYFMNTIGFPISDKCITIPGKKLCSKAGKTLKLYIRQPNMPWRLEKNIEFYTFHDLDKLLLTYGDDSEEQIQKQLSTVTDLAWTQSGMNESMEK